MSSRSRVSRQDWRGKSLPDSFHCRHRHRSRHRHNRQVDQQKSNSKIDALNLDVKRDKKIGINRHFSGI